MWQSSKKKSRPNRPKVNNGRWRLVVAIIFLLAGSLVYKLFILQVNHNNLYLALAANQQQVSSKLKPKRGDIYFTVDSGGKETLYPAATDREFAILYAIPKKIKNPQDLAKKFYEFFDRNNLEKDLADKNPDLASSSPAKLEKLIATSTREEKINSYLKHFDRPRAVYDSLNNKKVDIPDLLKLYAFLANSTSSPVRAKELSLKDNNVIYNNKLKNNGNNILKISGLGFRLQERRYYPEHNLGSHLLGFVSYDNASSEGKGRYGLEEFFNSELSGKYGFLDSDQGAGHSLIVTDRQKYTPAINGDNLILTIDRNIESVVCNKLQGALKKYKASGGSVIVVQPQTGAIIAMCSLPGFNPNNYQDVKSISVYNNPALLYQYEPGSVFKAMTMSAALDQGKVSPNTTYDDAGYLMIPGWPKPVRNSDYFTHGGHGISTMNTVLEYSLNTGAIFAMRQIGIPKFTKYVENYGFGEKTGIELGAESSGNISSLLQKRVPEIDAATASFGQGIAATPLQMVMAYQAIANKGILMKPYVVKAIIHKGLRENTIPKEVRRVISAKTAATISGMLVNVVNFHRGKNGFIKGYYIGGKTGTAQVADRGGYSTSKYFHTFVGIAPIDHPVFVMLVKLDNPDTAWAEGSALPLWRDIANFILDYYQVPKTRKN